MALRDMSCPSCIVLVEFGFWVKILRCFYGTRRPYIVWHLSCLYIVFCFSCFKLSWMFCWGDGRNIFNSCLFLYIYLNLFHPFILIIRLIYLRENSVIFLESSYWRGGLRPRCWIKVNFRCRSWNWLGLFDF